MGICMHIDTVKCPNCDPSHPFHIPQHINPTIPYVPAVQPFQSPFDQMYDEILKLTKLVKSLQDQLLSMDREIRALRREHSSR